MKEFTEYDADFVSDILRADSEPVEASFDNVTDMLDWLNNAFFQISFSLA